MSVWAGGLFALSGRGAIMRLSSHGGHLIELAGGRRKLRKFLKNHRPNMRMASLFGLKVFFSLAEPFWGAARLARWLADHA